MATFCKKIGSYSLASSMVVLVGLAGCSTAVYSGNGIGLTQTDKTSIEETCDYLGMNQNLGSASLCKQTMYARISETRAAQAQRIDGAFERHTPLINSVGSRLLDEVFGHPYPNEYYEYGY